MAGDRSISVINKALNRKINCCVDQLFVFFQRDLTGLKHMFHC